MSNTHYDDMMNILIAVNQGEMDINDEHTALPTSKEFYDSIDPTKGGIPGERSLHQLPKHTIVAEMHKDFEELTPTERLTDIQNYWKNADKKACRDSTDNTAAGVQESQRNWENRMSLKPPKNRDRRVPMDWRPLIDSEEPPSASEIAHAFGRLYDNSLVSDKGYHSSVLWDGIEEPELEGYNMHPQHRNVTFDDVDVQEMSWPEQREFRFNHPDAYDNWVERLKEEMGVWFDESLVLPEYLSPREPAIKVKAAVGFFQLWDVILENVSLFHEAGAKREEI